MAFKTGTKFGASTMAWGIIVAYLAFPVFGSLPLSSLLLYDENRLTNSKRSGDSTIAVYLNTGILNCGAPLVQDGCVAQPTNYSVTSILQTFTVQATATGYFDPYSFDLYSIAFGYSNVSIAMPVTTTFVTSATYILTITPTPAYIRSEATDIYEPSILPASTPLAARRNIHVPSPTSTVSPGGALRPRSYDYNPCDGAPPKQDFVSGSLTDVCHFLANIEQYFISLRPRSPAVYLPSWPSYLTQAVISLLDLSNIVNRSPSAGADGRTMPTIHARVMEIRSSGSLSAA